MNTSPPLTTHSHDDPFDQGLQFDLTTLAARRHVPGPIAVRPQGRSRRQALQWIGGGGLALIAAACGSGTTPTSEPTTSTAAAASTRPPRPSGPPPGAPPGDGGGMGGGQPADGTVPQETAGPYPGDGSNGPNVLAESGVVRRDMTTSLGATEPVPGVPLTVSIQLTNGAGGAPLAGAAVYLWHCDQQGRYSMYSDGVTDQTWLRAVQEADAEGKLTFTTIFPGCYDGRWPHMHFEVYPTLASATSADNKISTSQLAMTEAVASQVYAAAGYETSVTNLARVSLDSDGIFSDGADLETPVFTGDATNGLSASIVIPIAV